MALNPGQLFSELSQLRERIVAAADTRYRAWEPRLHRLSARHSARNLALYLALRRYDLRELQTELSHWGLSSLGRSESRVLATIDALLATLGALCQAPRAAVPPRPDVRSFERGGKLLRRNARIVFGPPRRHRKVRILVTLPPEAAGDYDLVHGLVMRGMDCARINCAHDGPDAWAGMIANLRRAAGETGRPCRVCMDLGGPKARVLDVQTPPDQPRLSVGDRMFLSAGALARRDDAPFRARCSLPEFVRAARVGGMVWMDDGRVGFRVEQVEPDGLLLCVTQTAAKGRKLRAGKGLNFPGANVDLSPLTDKDLADLEFVAKHADAIGYSFVQSAEDVERLQHELAARREPRRPPPAIVLKIETERAVHNLPDLMIQAGGRQPLAVMIARGDLAVEIGFQRLAEIQEEILWLCEAAHVPVVWATQVLESLAQAGLPSRAEITDAAMAERAECVMLNKGPFLAQAVATLDDVLSRMETHQRKKSPRLRALRAWE